MDINDDLRTLEEKTGFRETGRSVEVARLCAAYAQAWLTEVQVLEFGRSAEGRPMLAVVACRGDPRDDREAQPLGAVVELSKKILKGGVRGRVVVDLGA